MLVLCLLSLLWLRMLCRWFVEEKRGRGLLLSKRGPFHLLRGRLLSARLGRLLLLWSLMKEKIRLPYRSHRRAA